MSLAYETSEMKQNKTCYLKINADFPSCLLCIETVTFSTDWCCEVLACNVVELCSRSGRPQAMLGFRTANLHGIQPRAVLVYRLQKFMSCQNIQAYRKSSPQKLYEIPTVCSSLFLLQSCQRYLQLFINLQLIYSYNLSLSFFQIFPVIGNFISGFVCQLVVLTFLIQ